jgi:hypothetical protein
MTGVGCSYKGGTDRGSARFHSVCWVLGRSGVRPDRPFCLKTGVAARIASGTPPGQLEIRPSLTRLVRSILCPNPIHRCPKKRQILKVKVLVLTCGQVLALRDAAHSARLAAPI